MTSRKEMPKAREAPKEIPDVVVDPLTRKKYQKGRFLGKGGFARCYELTDMETMQIFAGKIVAKSLLQKQHQKDKMTQEIAIHRGVSHRHIVHFHSFFEDHDNVYILLELCRRRSLMELHKRRREVTEPEVRYFVRQVVLACDYLHKNHIIHRDLKLGNLFLNDEMEVKIGDFGLATRVEKEGERKRTLCGTPNYIAPEVLGKKGHSYEVDAWSLGCIVYTLLVGKPPFETKCLKDTYQKIKDNDYELKPKLSTQAKNLIKRLLRPDPSARPTMEQVLQDEFFTSGYLPAGLPTSCLTMAPRPDSLKFVDPSRKALTEINGTDGKPRVSTVKKEEPEVFKESSSRRADDCYLVDLYSQLTQLQAGITQEKIAGHSQLVMEYGGEDPAQDPSCIPIYWVSKWVDYSDKYGLGYQLCDNSIGVLFNDTTRLLLAVNGENIQYIERDGAEHFHTLSKFSDSLHKKITLLKYFRSYMNEHLLKAGADVTPREGDEMTRLPFLKTWFRTRNAMVLHLSNGTLQVNFFHDHTKVIVCPLMQAITYIDDKKTFRVYRMKLIERFGCSRELFSRLRYACTMVERLLNPRSSGSSASGSHKQRPASTGPGAQANGAAASRPTSAGSSVGQHPEHMGASHHNGRGPYQNPVA